MTPIKEMSLDELASLAADSPENERELSEVLTRLSEHASENREHVLAEFLLFLAECPSDVVAPWRERLNKLADRLHPDGEGRGICRIAARALAPFANDAAVGDAPVALPAASVERTIDAFAKVIPSHAIRLEVTTELHDVRPANTYRRRVTVSVGDTRIADGIGATVADACDGILNGLRKSGAAV